MSKKRKDRSTAEPITDASTDIETESVSVEANASGSTKFGKVYGYVRQRLWIIPVVLLLVAGAVGGVLKHLEEEARTQNRLPVAKRSALSSINPFVAMPSPTPTPQLSKEYIYAGSRLLAVEDANANAAPPADLAVWRPSTGYWFVLGGPGSAQTSFEWGSSGDTPVQGDFDGDGKTDFSVFRPSNNEWWISKSSDNSYYSVTFGSSGDITTPGDFDGDGKTDVAVYRPSNGTWYIIRSSDSTVISQPFGLSTDVPAPADFDGDGKADITVWRNSDNTFYTMQSSTGTLSSPSFGASGDVPIPADYDGDGKANYALKSGNSWIILNSAMSSTTSTTWQNATDIPVPNDYDGDGKVDIAVWRPANSPGNTDVGTWFIKKSSDGTTRTEAWGQSGDIPVPAYFRR